MKKRVSALVLALIIVFSVSAVAAVPRNVNPIDLVPSMRASSSGVTCSLKITAYATVTVSGTVTLYRNDSYVTSWPVTGLRFNETYTPVSKGTYRMDYDITVKGSAGSDHLTGSDEVTY